MADGAFPVGVVELAYATEPELGRRAELARADGFAHIDVLLGPGIDELALPVGCPLAFPKPAATWCSTPVPPAGEGAWDRAVRWWRAAPEALCEPWADGAISSVAEMRAFAAAVPGVRFLVDTGHVTAWGGDVLEALPLAGHVQLRDARAGDAQVAPGDGDVDFAAVLRRLERLGYRGAISVEYFDLPELGWPCETPREHALALRDLVVAMG
jgi:sugar phosphate isomerase/epimerase